MKLAAALILACLLTACVDILPALKDGDSNSENHATHD